MPLFGVGVLFLKELKIKEQGCFLYIDYRFDVYSLRVQSMLYEGTNFEK